MPHAHVKTYTRRHPRTGKPIQVSGHKRPTSPHTPTAAARAADTQAAAGTDPLAATSRPTGALGLPCDPPDELPVTPGLWYRLHWTRKRWETGEAALSVPGVAEDEDARLERFADDAFAPTPEPGYSCLSDPRALYAYLHSVRWVDGLDGWPHDHRVVMFTGEHVGHGADDEPTVAPDDDPEAAVEMTWEQFEDRVLSGRVAMDESFVDDLDPDRCGVATYGIADMSSPRSEELVLMPLRLGIADDVDDR